MSALVHQVTPVIAGVLAPDAGPYIFGFSYDDVEPDAAAIARAAVEAVRVIQKRTLSEIGHHLMRVKAALPHGQFGKWAEQELSIKPRAATNYMLAADWLRGKPETLADLPPTIIYALASPTAPQDIVHDVLARVETGSPLIPSVIRHKLAIAAGERAELKLAQKHSPKITAAEFHAKKLRSQERYAAADVKREQERQQQELERQTELLPLAREVFGLGRDAASAVLMVMFQGNYEARDTFTGLLRRFLDGAEA